MKIGNSLCLGSAVLLLIFGGGSAPVVIAPMPADADELRVCSDPNNLPFSNRKGEGFENKLAELVARDLGKHVTYVFDEQRDNFIRKTLGANRCDVVMGLPVGFPGVETTEPYYRSEYAFVYRTDRKLDLHSMKDARLAKLKIGVHLIGDVDTPPVQALARQGIVDNVTGYLIYGDSNRPNPPARVIEAVEAGDLDVAAVWGPFAAFFGKNSPVPLTVMPISDTGDFGPLVFGYEVALAVRPGNTELKSKLDHVLAEKRDDVRNLLQDYGLPIKKDQPLKE